MVKHNTVRLLEALEVRPWLAPLGIFILALAPRAALAVHLPAKILWWDGSRYLHVADNLILHGTFGSLRDNMYSVPTQPLLLAALRLLFGTNFTVLRLCFAVLGALTCVVCYLLARRLFGAATALLAAVGLALYPHYIYLSALFEYPQTFYILVMAVAFLLLYRYLASGGLGAIAGCGVLLGVAVESVPTVQLFIPLVLLCICLIERRAAAPAVILLCIGAAIPVGAWATRNYVAYGDPVLVNRAGGFSFWTSNNETYFLHGKQSVVPPCEINQKYPFCHEWMQIRNELSANHNLSSDQRVAVEDAANWQRGKQFLLQSPARTARLTVRKFLQFWTPIPDAVTNQDESGSAATKWISILSYLPVLILGLLGLIQSRRRWRELLPIYAYFAMFTAVYSVFLPTTRYRLPLDFFLVIFTAYSLTTLVPWRRAPDGASAPRPSSS